MMPNSDLKVLGETETAVYLRTLERVFAFGKGYALYFASLSPVLEMNPDTLFCQPGL